MAQAPKPVAQAKPVAAKPAAAKPAAAPAAASTKAAPAVGVQQVEQAKTITKAGNKVVLADGEARVDYIKRRFFTDKASRGTIAKELGVAYQIVFAATKTKKAQEAAAA